MITQVTSIEELKQIASELLFNKTDKVTKIADNSVLNGILYGVSKIGQKTLKEVALVEATLLPESAFEGDLDELARRRGIGSRLGARESSTYVLIVGTPGTVYDKNVVTIQSTQGINFLLENTETIGNEGYLYAKIKSQSTGENTNLDAFTINRISPLPVGHDYIINEYQATGGADIESDTDFRNRIIKGPNQLARTTLEFVKEILLKVNPNVLRVIYQGTNSSGKNVLRVLSQNGVDFTQNELAEFLFYFAPYMSFVELGTYEDGIPGLIFENIDYFPIDISFRCNVDNSYNVDNVRKDCQSKMSKILDLREWKSGQIIEWEDFLISATNTSGITYIADQYFFPRLDFTIPISTFPRIRGFRLLNLDGSLISSGSGNLNPIYFPAEADFAIQATLLNRI